VPKRVTGFRTVPGRAISPRSPVACPRGARCGTGRRRLPTLPDRDDRLSEAIVRSAAHLSMHVFMLSLVIDSSKIDTRSWSICGLSMPESSAVPLASSVAGAPPQERGRQVRVGEACPQGRGQALPDRELLRIAVLHRRGHPFSETV